MDEAAVLRYFAENDGVLDTGYDYTRTDTQLPHPGYAPQARLGVQRAGDLDEFDTVGLGRCRETEEWA